MVHFYMGLLRGYKSCNGWAVNHALCGLLWRLVLPDQLDLEPLLYQLSVLRVFHTVGVLSVLLSVLRMFHAAGVCLSVVCCCGYCCFVVSAGDGCTDGADAWCWRLAAGCWCWLLAAGCYQGSEPCCCCAT